MEIFLWLFEFLKIYDLEMRHKNMQKNLWVLLLYVSNRAIYYYFYIAEKNKLL